MKSAELKVLTSKLKTQATAQAWEEYQGSFGHLANLGWSTMQQGLDSRTITLECLRQQVVLLPQEAHFWSRSILDNFQSGTKSSCRGAKAND
ncbi:hypothetical protein [Nostoc sp. C117]|uniref:hypothetical protein n=1 Tax=Nostoc sp. C117 TaxID=3349875 RepID=UPI00370D5E24